MSAVSARLRHRSVCAGEASHGALADVPVGEPAIRLSGLRDLDADIARRLNDLGFRAGSSVTVLRRAPFGGPVIVRIADYEIALRRTEARAIKVFRER